MDSKRIIDQIEKIRKGNNSLWMDILRIAFECAPYRTRNIFKNITKNDSEITALSKKLCEEESNDKPETNDNQCE